MTNNKGDKERNTIINMAKYINKAVEEREFTTQDWNRKRLQRKKGNAKIRTKPQKEKKKY